MQIPRLRDFEDPSFNPFMSDELMFGDIVDPHAVLADLRERGPVHAGDLRALMGVSPDVTEPDVPKFIVVDYDEITKSLKNPELFSQNWFRYNVGLTFGNTLTTMDAPDHPKYRPLFQRIFLPKTISEWGSKIVDPVVDELIGQFRGDGKADLVEQFTLHYPFRVIFRQLGLPPEECATFHKLAVAQTVVMVDREHGVEAAEKLGEFLHDLVAMRRADPGDDLVSLLIQAEVYGERLPEDVIISFLRQLLNAGGDTTYRGTGTLLTQLLMNPDQLEAVRQDRSLIQNAIEEALRLDGPVTSCARWSTANTEIAGVKIPKNSIVQFMTAAANRDPAHFPDPDRYDIFRPNAKRHYAFAAGPHICIGQHLARLEMNRALTALLDRLPNLRLDSERPEPTIRGAFMRAPDHIFVKFDPVP